VKGNIMNTVLNPTTIDARLAQLRELFGPPPVLSSENLNWGDLWNVGARHSGFAPESFTTFAHFSVSSAISLPKSAGEPGGWTRQNEQAAVWPLRESTDHTLDFSSGMHRCRNESNSNGSCHCLYLSHISHQARPSGL
jgi:hypothetical protein